MQNYSKICEYDYKSMVNKFRIQDKIEMKKIEKVTI
jgi:hypothetical protein